MTAFPPPTAPQDAAHLDRTGDAGWALGFCVWGEVEEGLDVADALGELPTTKKGGLAMFDEPVGFIATLE